MEYAFTKSGNVIAKDAKIKGANFIVNQGKSFIGSSAEILGDRNNGKPTISWGQYVILDDAVRLSPPQRQDKFYPIIVGHHVYIGKSTVVEAASIGSHVLIGNNCTLGQFAILKDCVVIPDNAEVPPYAVVGPSSIFTSSSRPKDLPEAAADAIDSFCESKLLGISVEPPTF